MNVTRVDRVLLTVDFHAAEVREVITETIDVVGGDRA